MLFVLNPDLIENDLLPSMSMESWTLFFFIILKVDMKRKFLFSHMKVHEKQE